MSAWIEIMLKPKSSSGASCFSMASASALMRSTFMSLPRGIWETKAGRIIRRITRLGLGLVRPSIRQRQLHAQPTDALLGGSLHRHQVKAITTDQVDAIGEHEVWHFAFRQVLTLHTGI